MGAGAIALRPYQEEARQAISRQWESGCRRTLLVLPTGTGKTIVFAKAIEDAARAGARSLVLAHRGELLDQAAAKIEAAAGLKCSREQAGESCAGTFYSVTVGSVQTLMREKRLEKLDPRRFGVVVVDEAHHCLADSYQKILGHFGGARVLGVTATPDRGDMKNLGRYFDSLAYEYTLPRAVREGYLCRIMAQTIPLKLDMSGVGVSQGDFRAAEAGEALEPYLKEIAREMALRCAGRKTVAFLPLVSTSRKLCALLRENGLKAAEINGGSKDRAEILRAFEAGEHDILTNSMLLTEGWDCPPVDCIAVLRPTKIRSLYAQMVGRGTRPHPGKKDLLLLDFLWHSERHELCRPACLIAGSGEVGALMARAMEGAAGGEPMDLMAAGEDASSRAVGQRERALAKKLAEMRRRSQKLVDPLQYAMSIAAEDLSGYEPAFGWEMAPPSEKQLAALEKAGIMPDGVENAGMASKLLDRLRARRAEGLATPRQIRFLEGRGFLRVGTWQLAEAQKMVGMISQNGWRVPRGIEPALHAPERPPAWGEYGPFANAGNGGPGQ
jgi:superfamily II DNA or RNA helicase